MPARHLSPALRDLLRRTPTVAGHTGGPLFGADEDVVAGTTRVVASLREPCLVIQGPFGAGKTYTAARVILALLAAGKSVGVTSNSPARSLAIVVGDPRIALPAAGSVPATGRLNLFCRLVEWGGDGPSPGDDTPHDQP